MGRLIAVVAVLIFAVVLPIRPALVASTATPAPAPPALSPLLTAWLAAFNAHDPDRLLALFADDARWQEVAIALNAQGPDQIRAHLTRACLQRHGSLAG